jgi:hypothetical protein
MGGEFEGNPRHELFALEELRKVLLMDIDESIQ